MKILIIAVGRVKERAMKSVLEDYLGRIGRYGRFEHHELKDGSADEVTRRFEKAIPAGARTVALEVEGQLWSSQRLAEEVQTCEVRSVPALAFLIGGSYGLPEPVRRAADVQLSFGRITLPHRLARVILAEQIYRAYTILRNEPYSH